MAKGKTKPRRGNTNAKESGMEEEEKGDWIGKIIQSRGTEKKSGLLSRWASGDRREAARRDGGGLSSRERKGRSKKGVLGHFQSLNLMSCAPWKEIGKDPAGGAEWPTREHLIER